jgi:hypothetical protein
MTIRKVLAVILVVSVAVSCACCGTRDVAKKPGDSEWIALFNGRDLSGWTEEGRAAWTVEDGCLVGTQGRNGAPGDLFTDGEYDDFELIVTYKMRWPANSGVWFRYQAPDKAYQADILEYENPECYSGTLYCPGKMFLAMNEDPDIVNREGWNTLKIRAEGDHLVITLNEVVVGDVREDSFARGRIGFQVHAGDNFKNMMITVREVLIRPLG